MSWAKFRRCPHERTDLPGTSVQYLHTLKPRGDQLCAQEDLAEDCQEAVTKKPQTERTGYRAPGLRGLRTEAEPIHGLEAASNAEREFQIMLAAAGSDVMRCMLSILLWGLAVAVLSRFVSGAMWNMPTLLFWLQHPYFKITIVWTYMYWGSCCEVARRMDFSGLEAGRLAKNLTVPQDQASLPSGGMAGFSVKHSFLLRAHQDVEQIMGL